MSPHHPHFFVMGWQIGIRKIQFRTQKPNQCAMEGSAFDISKLSQDVSKPPSRAQFLLGQTAHPEILEEITLEQYQEKSIKF